MWTPKLDNELNNIHLAILTALSEDVERGRLRPGDPLPPQRDLARRLGVSLGTVTKAYKRASDLGLIHTRVGKGTIVADRAGRGIGDPPPISAPPNTIDMCWNHPVPAGAEEERLLRSSLGALSRRARVGELLQQRNLLMSAQHRHAARTWLSRCGVTSEDHEVVITVGARHALAVTLLAHAKPGDVVATSELTHPAIMSLARHLRLELVGLACDESGILPDAFEQAIRGRRVKFLYCIPSAASPTGATMPVSRRTDIGDIARKRSVHIIEHDQYNALLSDAPAPIAASFGDVTFHICDTTWSIATNIRVAFMRAPGDSVRQILAALEATVWMPAPLMVELVSQWIESDVIENLNNIRRRRLAERERAAREILGRHRYRWTRDAPFLWLELPGPWTSGRLVREAASQGVLLGETDDYRVGRSGPQNGQRVCLGEPPDMERLREGLTIIADILELPPQIQQRD